MTDAVSELGLELERGFIKIGNNQRTNVAQVYAVGDVAGGFGLAHEAYAEEFSPSRVSRA